MRSLFHWGEAYLTGVHSARPVAPGDGTGVVNMFSNESREGRVGRLARCVFVPQALRVAILKA